MIIRRDTTFGSNDLNVAYRPCKVDELIGNETNKKVIKNALDNNKVPHTQLFVGDAGCGKTTAAKIIALGLNCQTNGVSSNPCLECDSCRNILDGNSIDVKEINVGQTGGKDYVSKIVQDLPMSPFSSRFKVLIFDEAHELTTAAKDLLLKPTENGYKHVYFIFCTNQPEKLQSKVKGKGEPFLGRCSVHNFGRLDAALIRNLLLNVCEFEGFQYDKKVLDMIVDCVKGVPRDALVKLNQIAIEASWSLEAAQSICGSGFSSSEDPRVFELSKKLNSGSFKESVALFSKINNMTVESIRIQVATYFVSCLKNSKKVPQAKMYSKVLDIVTVPIYEQGILADHKWYNCMFKITDAIMEGKKRR
jgi:DNA polymerase III subunit gamma/tau